MNRGPVGFIFEDAFNIFLNYFMTTDWNEIFTENYFGVIEEELSGLGMSAESRAPTFQFTIVPKY